MAVNSPNPSVPNARAITKKTKSPPTMRTTSAASDHTVSPARLVRSIRESRPTRVLPSAGSIIAASLMGLDHRARGDAAPRRGGFEGEAKPPTRGA